MLLSGVLNLQDRERLLEVLGPLNQVVVLEGKRHQELTLPPDLVRIPALLDGSRTLLELSRESGVEPFRLGAFVLFLREMGWARLHELPPLDRRALEMALDPPPAPPISPALPEPPPERQPSLFAEIQASQFPTTNLEHLSEALDQLGPEDEIEAPFAPNTQPLRSPEPSLPIHHSAAGSTRELEPPTPAPAAPSRRPWVLLVLFLGSLGLWGGLRWYQRNPIILPKLTQASREQAVTSAPKLTPPTLTKTAPEPETKAPPAKAVPDALPTPAPSAPPSDSKSAAKPPALPSKADRLQAILDGNLKLAATQGVSQRKAIQGKWTLRLEIACQAGTIQHAAGLLKDRDPDLFIVPMAMRDGRTCYQVFLGSYGSEAAARDAAKRLPPLFLAEGNRPKPFRVAQIPDRQ
jgi:septal ring-binding cell division protein DamX